MVTLIGLGLASVFLDVALASCRVGDGLSLSLGSGLTFMVGDFLSLRVALVFLTGADFLL